MPDDPREMPEAQASAVEEAIQRNLEAHRAYYHEWLASRLAAIKAESDETGAGDKGGRIKGGSALEA